MSRDVCEHFNPIDLPCDQCNSETQQTLEIALARHANLIRQIFNYAIAPRRPVELTDEEIEDLYFDGFSISKLKDFARAVIAAYEAKQGEQT